MNFNPLSFRPAGGIPFSPAPPRCASPNPEEGTCFSPRFSCSYSFSAARHPVLLGLCFGHEFPLLGLAVPFDCPRDRRRAGVDLDLAAGLRRCNVGTRSRRGRPSLCSLPSPEPLGAGGCGRSRRGRCRRFCWRRTRRCRCWRTRGAFCRCRCKGGRCVRLLFSCSGRKYGCAPPSGLQPLAHPQKRPPSCTSLTSSLLWSCCCLLALVVSLLGCQHRHQSQTEHERQDCHPQSKSVPGIGVPLISSHVRGIMPRILLNRSLKPVCSEKVAWETQETSPTWEPVGQQKGRCPVGEGSKIQNLCLAIDFGFWSFPRREGSYLFVDPPAPTL